MKKPLLSFIVVDSRSLRHPDWVGQCLESIQDQTVFDDCELIVVNNVERDKTIGQCFNAGVKEAKGDIVCFVGDDDYLAEDMAEVILRYFNSEYVKKSNIVSVTTNMFVFNDGTAENFPMSRQWTGAWKRDYLLKYPFNEKLEKGIDREYIEETQKRNDLILLIKYYFGYFYRRHQDYRCAGDIIFHNEVSDYYFITANRIFLSPITKRFEKQGSIFISPHFDLNLAKQAKVVWMEWANEKAIEVSNAKLDAIKILRIHAFEAFTEYAHKINWNGFDHVIFIDEYIKDYVEKQYGKVNGAVIIPNGVELDKFTFKPKVKNNKVACAGYLTRKKGIGELLLIAKSLPEYEFHIAGKYQENDIADWFSQKTPNNVKVDCWQYDINEWYQDKSFIINTSMRESQAMTLMEGMACGLRPIVNDWIGAEEIYGKEYVYKNIQDIRRMLEGDYEPEKYREFVKLNYNFEDTYKKISDLVLVEV